MTSKNVTSMQPRARLFGAVEYLILFYVLMDSLAPRGVVAWQFSFAVVMLGTTLIALSKLGKILHAVDIKDPAQILFLTIIISGFMYGVGAVPFFPEYFAGDSGLFFLFYLYYLLIKSEPERIKLQTLVCMAILFTIFCFFSYVSSVIKFLPQYDYGIRYDYPKILAFTGLAAGVVWSRGGKRFAFLIGLLVATYLGIDSTWRAALMFAVVAYGMVVFCGVSSRTRVIILVVAAYCLIIGFFLRQDLYAIAEALAQGSRFEKLFSQRGDESFLGRVTEAMDVTYYFFNQFSPYEIIFGRGHGATFVPILSSPEVNIVEGYRVHNIHFNVFLLLYRYGLFGFLSYFLFVFFVILDLFRFIFKHSKWDPKSIVLLFSALNIVILSVNYTPINDPANLYVICAYLVFRPALHGRRLPTKHPVEPYLAKMRA